MEPIKKRWYLRWWMIILYLFILLIIISSVNLAGNEREDKERVETAGRSEGVESTPPIEVTAVKLVADYKANQVAADAMYKDKVVKVTGTVDSIGKDIADRPYITLGDGKEYSIDVVQCFFSEEDESELATVSKGKQMTLQGIVSGTVINNVIVKSCLITE